MCYASVTMCQQLLTVNLDEKLNSSSIQELQHLMCRGYKGSFGVSSVFFGKRLDINLDKHV